MAQDVFHPAPLSITFFVKDLYKCKKTTTFVTKYGFDLLYR